MTFEHRLKYNSENSANLPMQFLKKVKFKLVLLRYIRPPSIDQENYLKLKYKGSTNTRKYLVI